MLERPPRQLPPEGEAARRRRRREVKAASAGRAYRGDYFFKRVVTRDIRSRLVAFGMIRSSEEEDRAAVLQALSDIIDDALHLRNNSRRPGQID